MKTGECDMKDEEINKVISDGQEIRMLNIRNRMNGNQNEKKKEGEKKIDWNEWIEEAQNNG